MILPTDHFAQLFILRGHAESRVSRPPGHGCLSGCGARRGRPIIRAERAKMGFKEESEKLLSGELSIRERHPLIPTGESEEVAAGVMFLRWFANMTAIKTEDGLVLVDTGGDDNQAEPAAMVRRRAPDRGNTPDCTHGHPDHAAGT